MEPRRVSIEDIARAAGVSHSTVSRALRDNGLISTKVREQIKQLAREMGYVPNAVAQSLQTQRTNTIGVVVTSIADPFFAQVVNGIERVAKPAGLSLILSVSNRDVAQEMAAIETFHRRRIDGIIVADAQIGSQHQAQLARISVPTILINNQVAGEQVEIFHSVTVDDYLGSGLAVEHLLKLGHRSIGYLGVGNRPRSNQRRQEGYRAALANAGLTSAFEQTGSDNGLTDVTGGVDNPANPGNTDVEAGRQLLPALLKSGATAAVCYNDMVAVGLLLACRERGLKIPTDLSIVGFDDIELARYVSPSLTTVHQPMLEIGWTAMQMLLDLLDAKQVQNRVLTPFLVERGSTARLQSLEK